MKRHILTAVAVSALALTGACSVETTDGGKSVDNTGSSSSGSKSTDSSGSSGSKSKASEKASSGTKKKSSATTVGGFQIVGKVQITKDALGDFTAVMRAKNTTDGEKVALFKVTVLKGTNILGSIDCIGGGGNPVAAGATTTAACSSVDKFKSGWDDVQIEFNGF